MLIILRKISTVILLLFSFSFVCFAADEVEVSAVSAVLIDGDTLEILYEKNACDKRSMASTTKIMTSLLAVESGLLDETVTVKDKVYIEGTAIGFDKGDKFTLETLCYAMLLESGNDAAVLTAEFLAGSEEKFSKLMNKKAESLGMVSTNFVTASGLDAKEHYSTAYDMALLGAYAVNNVIFREICSTKNYKAEFISSDKVRVFTNHNKLLSVCDGIIGIKTGFTKKSGRCLVSACEREGKTLVAVTLGAPDDWNDHQKLYDYGFSLYETRNISMDIPLSLPVYGSETDEIRLNPNGELTAYALKNSSLTVKTCLRKIIYAPVVKQEIIGSIIVMQNGVEIKEIPLISCNNADVTLNFKKYKPSFKERLLNKMNDIFKKKGRSK